MNVLNVLARFSVRFYSPLIIAGAVCAFFHPDMFKKPSPYIPQLLGIVMLGMGLTLKKNDFAEIIRKPSHVALGVFLQFFIMPALGFAIAKISGISNDLAAGFILVGCVPCGTAANVMTFLAKGDVALSVTICSITTIIAPFATPYLFLFLGGTYIPIDAFALFGDIMKIVLLPVIAGIILRHFFDAKIQKITGFVPLVSIAAIFIIVSAVVASSADKIVSVAGIVIAGVVIHNIAGLIIAYLTARMMFGISVSGAKAVMFNVGVQNSGLGAALAMIHLSPTAALPSAVFSVWQNISGPVAASWFVRRKKRDISK